jgi:hypothetical protein
MLRSAALLVLLALCGCTDARLEAGQPEPPPPVDDKLAIEGRLCTRTPRDELFPVKILFVMDTSNSMAITDRESQAARALFQVIDRYRGNPSVRFGVIAFDSRSEVLTRDATGAPGFTATPDLAAIDARLRAPDLATDYQGALATAYGVLFDDMAKSSPEERSRSKYVVVFFSDGNPDPQCWADPARSGDEPLVCDIARDRWPDTINPPAGYSEADFQNFFADLEAGRDYNTDEQIVTSVQDIAELQEIFQVNELRFHTGFLFDPAVMDGPFKDAFQLDRDAGIALLRAMKDAGNGTFTEFTSGGSINFLNINYASVKKSYGLTNLVVLNEAVANDAAVPRVDSDGDGLSDEEEDALRLCAYLAGGPACAGGDPADTDSDGYGDLFEHRLRGAGFDPAVPAAVPCDDRTDIDGDGLRGCEEAFLGTRPAQFDTDGDRLPDGVEFRFGLEPLDPDDAFGDLDADGVRNADEVLEHASPILREPAANPPPRYRYDVRDAGEQPDGSRCYEFRVDNVQLQTTRAATADRRGLNRIWLYFLEGPPNDPRDFGNLHRACVDARYIAPDLKVPAIGRVELDAGDFADPLDPDAALRCVGATTD